MKILHTADWHIGKKLHKYDLTKDFDLFIDWLCDTIKTENIEVLLVSGDIFDLANPSSQARKQYYRSLIRLRELNCKLILTGGNHDSPAMLNAPAEILRELDMHVIGGLPEKLEDCIIPIKNKSAEVKLVIAALPYLREADLRDAAENTNYEDRLEQLRAGINYYFKEAANLCSKNFPQIQAVAMGHLFAAGAKTSESERDIQIGNLAAFNALQFGEYFQYIALGHIHKPQKIRANVPVYYSGSPIQLSFSERKDHKRVLILDTEDLSHPKNLEIPVFRNLLKLNGSLEKIEEKMAKPGQIRQLDSLIEIEMLEENYNADKIIALDQLINEFDLPGFQIVKHRINFKNQSRNISEIYPEKNLEDLSPQDVFNQLLKQQDYDKETLDSVNTAFNELLEDLYRDENQTEI